MSVDRRQFLLSAAALATAPALPAFGAPAAVAAPGEGGIFPPSVRADFPIASNQTYLNSASIHPMSVPASRALDDHVQFRLKGGGEGRTGLHGGSTSRPEEAIRRVDQRTAAGNCVHRKIPPTAKTSSSWEWTCRAKAATSFSTSCTSRRRSTCTNRSRPRARTASRSPS